MIYMFELYPQLFRTLCITYGLLFTLTAFFTMYLFNKKQKKIKVYKMVVFISQPMKDLTKEEILDRREFIKDKIRNIYGDDVFIIDSVLKLKNNPVYMLGTSIMLMSHANLVVFDKGWDKARGCIIEHKIAEDYGLNILEL